MTRGIIDNADADARIVIDDGAGDVVITDDPWSHDITPVDVSSSALLTPGTLSQVQIDDAIINRQTGAEVLTEGHIEVAGYRAEGMTFESLDPDIATIDPAGVYSRVTNGIARINVSNGWIKRQIAVTVNYDSPGVHDTLAGWDPDSLAYEMTDQVDGRIAGLDPLVALNLFAVKNHATATYTRNINHWAADLDFTGVAAWNSSTNDGRKAGVAITPDAMLVSEHYPIGVGTQVRFIKIDGSVVTMTVAAVADVGPANAADNYATDMRVCRFTESLPAGISYYEVMPSNLEALLPSLQWRVPVVRMDQDANAIVADLYSVDGRVALVMPNDTQRLAFFRWAEDKDSGGEVFAIAKDRPVLATTLTFGGAGKGPDYDDLHDAINAALTAAGSAYQLSVFDAGEYNVYGY